MILNKFSFFRYNNKTYRIDDIAWDKSPESTFQYHDGTEMTYLDYYKYVWYFFLLLFL